MLDNFAIHSILGGSGWARTLLELGIDEKHLRNKHGPCPMCGGKDRFRFDNKDFGKWFCNQCGAGDGFKLVMMYLGCDFKEARKQVINVARLEGSEFITEQRKKVAFAPPPVEKAEPTPRANAIKRESCVIENCDAAMIYLESRKLWPLPIGHLLRAHPCVDYYEDGKRIGKFPALIAEVRDIMGELVTLHITYLEPSGKKIEGRAPRKILSALTGRESCGVMLMPISGEILGVGEGIETSLSASKIHNIPVWSMLNTSLLSKFNPPASICKLIIFADRDIGGLEAAMGLMERLQQKVHVEVKTPRKPNCNDWNDVLLK